MGVKNVANVIRGPVSSPFEGSIGGAHYKVSMCVEKDEQQITALKIDV